MMAARDFVRARPVLSYYILTFAVSWSLIALVLGPGGFLGTSETIIVSGPLGLTGPSIAGVLLTSVIAGRASGPEGAIDEVACAGAWYAVALLTAPVLKAATLLALLVASSQVDPAIVSEESL
jgi:hypothetical protein